MELVRKAGIIGAAAVGVLAGCAVGQEGDFKKPLARTRVVAPEGATSGSQTRIHTQDGDDSYEIVIQNGEVSAKVNGKKVPAERIRQSKDKVEILDKDGEVLKSFDVVTSAGGGNEAWRVYGPGQMNMRGFDLAENPKPKVMIGITMSEDEDGIAVAHVYEGLPAEKAGLKEQDIIIAIDGNANIDQKTFREALNRKEPGDKVKLKIKRDGKEKDLTVELQKFDSEKLGQGQFEPMGGFQGIKGMENWPPEARKQFEEAMKQVPEGNRFVWGQNNGEGFKFTPFGAAPDNKRVEELDRKIAELDEKLSKINDQMARLEKLLNKLGEKDGGR